MTAGNALCGLIALSAAVGVAGAGHARPLTFSLEPGSGIHLDAPQTDRFTPGFDVALRLGVPLWDRLVAPQLSYGFFVSPPRSGYAALGGVHSLTSGLRFRPLTPLLLGHPILHGVCVDFDLGWAGTGPHNRFTFDASLGYDHEIRRWFRLGVFARYSQIHQSDADPVLDHTDPKLLVLGVTMTLSFDPDPPPRRVVVQLPPRAITYVVERRTTELVHSPPPRRTPIPAVLMFKVNGFDIHPRFLNTLSVYADYFDKYDLSDDLICVRGYSSPDSCPCNDVLSQARANTVVKVLKRRMRRNASAFAASGAGAADPIVPRKARDARRNAAINRRVVFRWMRRDRHDCRAIDIERRCKQKRNRWGGTRQGRYCARLCEALMSGRRRRRSFVAPLLQQPAGETP